MLNNVAICGRLTRDIEIKTFDSGSKTANFSLAVQRNFKNKDGEYEADFINCDAWGATVDFLSKYFKKGDFVVAGGEIRTREWTDDNGNKRRITYVAVSNVTSVATKGGGSKPTEEKPPQDDFTAAGFDSIDIPDEGDLPF